MGVMEWDGMEASTTFICSPWHGCVDLIADLIARQVKIPGTRGR